MKLVAAAPRDLEDGRTGRMTMPLDRSATGDDYAAEIVDTLAGDFGPPMQAAEAIRFRGDSPWTVAWKILTQRETGNTHVRP